MALERAGHHASGGRAYARDRGLRHIDCHCVRDRNRVREIPEKTIAHCRLNRYESYEPDREWSDWLEREYDIISQPTDEYSLRHTSAGSVDVVHAHGVFVYLPFLTTYRYFREIARVIAPGAYVVFDIIIEDCGRTALTTIFQLC